MGGVLWGEAMKRILLIAALAAFVVSDNGQAVTSKGRFTILGEGNTSCGDWLQQRKSNLWMNEASWVLGYLSAINERVWKGGSNLAAGTDPAGIEAWVDSYCTTHPLDDIHRAASMLVPELMRRQRP